MYEFNLISVLLLFISAIIGLIYLICWLYRKIKNNDLKPAINLSELDQKFRKLTIKTKIKRWAITAWIALVVVSALWFIGWQLNSAAMEKAYNDTVAQANNFLLTQEPNIYANNQIVTDYGTFSSNLHSDTYKDIDGYQVPWEAFDWGYGTFAGGGPIGYQTFSYQQRNNGNYTQGQQKVASFISPTVNQKDKNYYGLKTTHEASTLKDLPNHLAEVAVSFDKPYSYAEIQKMIPSNLLINWYWIGLSDPSNVDAASSGSTYGLGSDFGAGGNLSGKLSDETYKTFVFNVEEAQKYPVANSTINNFSPTKDALKQVEKYPTLPTAKFSGVILTGRTENLVKLDQESWAFATNVGLTTELLPYQKPTK